MAVLTGSQAQQFHQALLAAFPNEMSLRQLVRFELGQNLLFITKSDGLASMVFELIEWAEANGTLVQLVQGAQNTNPDHPQLRAFIAEVLPELQSSAPSSPPSPPPQPSFAKWQALLSDLDSGQCTPILGPGLLEPLLGSSEEMAHRWAELYRFPRPPLTTEDLPQVAQFLATVQNPNTLRAEFRKYLTTELLERYGDVIPAEHRNGSPDDLLLAVASARWVHDATDPYRVLADLPFSLYITANPDNLLVEALRAAGRAPEVEMCRWIDDDRWPKSVYEREPRYQPSVTRPLIYNLFGRLSHPFSLVLKEDDYLDYVAGFERMSNKIPPSVRAALSDSALLFLGFRLDDWGFRVLFRTIVRRSISERHSQYTHVAVQLNPQAENSPDPESAQVFLESYFRAAAVLIYWGRIEQFLEQFRERWTQYKAGRRTS